MSEVPSLKPKSLRSQRFSQSLSRLGDKAGSAIQRSADKTQRRAMALGAGTQRAQQMLAAMCLPFTIVLAMGTAEVVEKTVISLVPAGFAATDLIRFLLGAVLFVAAFVIQFVWVKTGGFGIFPPLGRRA